MSTTEPIILIAEDNVDTRLLLMKLGEQNGFKMLEASNGLEAVVLAEEETPDLIILDLDMPLMDGLTAAEEIRAQQRLQKIPILFMTAHGKLGIQLFRDVELLGEGRIDYLAKPFSVPEFEESVKNILDIRVC
jgi:CheY-like chemotaxis protein